MLPESNLPSCWNRPSPPSPEPASECIQRTLFETKPEDILAELKVSTSDMERWYQNGWISYQLQDVDHFSGPHEKEIRFVSPIARSGLSDSQITQLLKELEQPYYYSDDVAYHFKYGWVTPSPAFDFISSNLDDWLEQLAEEGDINRLSEIANKVDGLLNTTEEDEKSKPDVGREPHNKSAIKDPFSVLKDDSEDDGHD